MLRIALDYRPALLGRSGIGRATRELARALAAEDGCELHLFAHTLARARVATPLPQGARLHRLPLPGRSLPALARLGLPADRLAGGCQVFHWTDYVHPPVGRAAAVLTVHDLAFARNPSFHGHHQAAELLERTRCAARSAAAVVVPSQATADDVRTFLPEARQVHLIPFGADHVPLRRPGHPLGGRPFVLCLGTIEPRKNHQRLLEAWQTLTPPRPLLVVAGAPGWECADTVAALTAAEATGDVRWFRRADDSTVFALLAHAQAFCYPSSWEGFGFPVLEAMLLGVPTVAGDCPALRELCDGAAEFCSGADSSSIATALSRVLGDADLRRRLGQEGPRRAGCFRWSRCARAHAALYREVAG